MRGLLLAFTLSLSHPSGGADPWFAQDKVQHFFASAFVQSISYGALRAVGVRHGTALAGATATTAVVGIGKELHDMGGRGDPSLKDLAWDAAGAGAMTVVLSKTAR